ncbi:hypothetical protein N9Y48_01430 [Zobellia sp.]|nr:hypothetical protein [Zobellia sp.]
MAQLTKDQIKFIDDYLKKNKVAHWDVRMELLDHVASAVEEEMAKGVSFDQALIKVHMSFGNKWKSKKLSKDQKNWIFTESIYADNSGYKKFITVKHKLIQLQLRKMHREALVSFFKTPLLLFCYTLGLYLLVTINGYTDTLFSVLAVIICITTCIPLLVGFINYLKHGKSIYLSVLSGMSMGAVYISWNILFYWPKSFLFAANKDYSHWYFVFMCAILLPLLFMQTKVFFIYLSKLKKIQSKLV